MVNRTDSFDEDMSVQMRKNKKVRKGYLLALIEEDGYTVEEALIETINVIGQREFSKLCDVEANNLNAFVKGKRKIKRETLDIYLKAFGLKTYLGVEELRAA